MVPKKIYFTYLDNLRTYAFLIVFISHAYFGFLTVTDYKTSLFAHGEMGVQVFFVLSAFLITYLSINQYKKTGDFSVIHFFKKRILRIWPVYFLVILISLLWYVYAGDRDSIGCMYSFLYFLGNTCMIDGIPDIAGSATVAPMWSVSIEQQFYTVFPIGLLLYILFTSKSVIWKKYFKYILHAILISCAMYSLYIRYTYAYDWTYVSYAIVPSLFSFISGMYLGYVVYKKNFIIDHVYRYKNIYVTSAILTFISSFCIKFFGSIGVSLYIVPLVFATCLYIVFAVGDKGDQSGGFIQKVIQYLGKISYGLYAYHMFGIVIVQHSGLSDFPTIEIVLALSITILMAHISYRYIESWFLRFK